MAEGDAIGEVLVKGRGWVPARDLGQLPPSYNPQEAQQRLLDNPEPYQKQREGVVVQGPPLSDTERAFWAQNPMGAIKDPVTGGLIGSGTTEASRSAAVEGAYPQPTSFVPAATSQARVDSDSLMNAAISRRQELEGQRMGLQNQRSDLIRQLGATPLGRRGQVSPQGRAIMERLKSLSDDERNLTSEEHFTDFETSHRINSAFRNAVIADRNLDIQRKEQTARDAAGMMSELSRIEGTYKHGTPEFQNALMDAEEKHPMWIHNASAAAAVRKAAEFHDAQAAKAEAKLGNSLFQQTSLTPEQFASLPAESGVAGEWVVKQGKNDVAAKPGTPGATFKPTDGGSVVELTLPSGVKTHIGRDAYSRYLNAFRPTAVPAASATPTQEQPVRRYNPQTGQLE